LHFNRAAVAERRAGRTAEIVLGLGRWPLQYQQNERKTLREVAPPSGRGRWRAQAGTQPAGIIHEGVANVGWIAV
jgi:hypothetical protein